MLDAIENLCNILIDIMQNNNISRLIIKIIERITSKVVKMTQQLASTLWWFINYIITSLHSFPVRRRRRHHHHSNTKLGNVKRENYYCCYYYYDCYMHKASTIKILSIYIDLGRRKVESVAATVPLAIQSLIHQIIIMCQSRGKHCRCNDDDNRQIKDTKGTN